MRRVGILSDILKKYKTSETTQCGSPKVFTFLSQIGLGYLKEFYKINFRFSRYPLDLNNYAFQLFCWYLESYLAFL